MSPVRIRKVNGYQVRTPSRITARKTSWKKAQRQARILRAIEHTDWRPTGARAKRAVRARPRTRRSRNSRRKPKGRS